MTHIFCFKNNTNYFIILLKENCCLFTEKMRELFLVNSFLKNIKAFLLNLTVFSRKTNIK